MFGAERKEARAHALPASAGVTGAEKPEGGKDMGSTRRRDRRRAVGGLGFVIIIWGVWQAAGAGRAHAGLLGSLLEPIQQVVETVETVLNEAVVSQGLLERLEDPATLLAGLDKVPVIIQTSGPVDGTLLNTVTLLGGVVGKPFESIQGFPALVPISGLKILSWNSLVLRISFDATMLGQIDNAALSSGARAVQASPGYEGGDITVAVLDSGVAPVGDLKHAGIVEIDFTTGSVAGIERSPGSSSDPMGHGTAVAGLIAGSGRGSDCPECFRDFRSVAPRASIVSLKVLDARGGAPVSRVLRAIDWLRRNHEERGIRVLNASLGHPIEESYLTDPLCRALERLWDAGVVVVVSAGNSGSQGYATITSPANDPYVITVGAVEDWDTVSTDDDVVAPFSSRGPTAVDGIIKPDLVAPGASIISLRSPGSYIDKLFPGARLTRANFSSERGGELITSPYMSLSGSSLSAPIVAGAAALLLEQDPSASPDDVKARLLRSARKTAEPIVARGAGILDVEGALLLGERGLRASRTPSPRLLVDEAADGLLGIVIEDLGLAWGDPETWSSEGVWGSVAIWGLSPLWSDSQTWGQIAIWGARAQTLNGQIAIWGASGNRK